MADYENIESPYDGTMNRSTSDVADLASYDPTTDPYESMPNTVDQSQIQDLWIGNWIKSRNYQPKTQGFYLDGKTGYLEAQSIFIGNSDTYFSFSPGAGMNIVGASYYTSLTGARLEIFPKSDPDVGLRVIDNAAKDVFRAMIGGTDIGDIFIGDVTSGIYAQWDKSATEFRVEGGIITGGIVRTAATGVRIWMEGNDLSLYDASVIGIGDSTSIKFERTDGTWAGDYTLTRRTSTLGNDYNIFEMYPTANATGAGKNHMYFGRQGSTTTSYTDNMTLAANTEVEIQIGTSEILSIMSDGVHIDADYLYLNITDKYEPFVLNYDSGGVPQPAITVLKKT